MKIGIVSTYPPAQCGIATYTRKLLNGFDGIADVELSVLGEHLETPADEVDAVEITRCFKRGAPFSDLVGAATAQGVQVAHFQHAPDIFGMGDALFDAIEGLKAAGIRVVVTLHTVFTVKSGLLERKPFVRTFHRRLGASADHLIVHTQGSREILVDHGVPRAKVTVIPHGTDAPEMGDRAAGRKYMGLSEDDDVLLFFGFIHIQKNIHRLIATLAKLRKSHPKLKLVVAGKVAGGAWYNRLYLKYMRQMAKRLGVADRVVIIDRFIADEDIADLHAAATLVALPHAQGYASASGVVHGAMAMSVPMVCSDGPKFEEVRLEIDAGLVAPAGDTKAWARLVGKMIDDTHYREAVIEKTRKYTADTQWPVVAKAHLAPFGG